MCERNRRRAARDRALRALFLILAIALAPAMALAQAGQPSGPVYFSGIAFTGSAADLGTEFPHLSRALDRDHSREIIDSIRQALQKHPAPMDVVFDQLGSTRDAARSTAMALAIDRETTSVVKIADLYKIRLEISAQVLFFDFKEKQVLGGFPIILDYIDAQPSEPTDADVQHDFESLLNGAAGSHSLAGDFVEALARISVPGPATRHLRVTGVSLGPKALDYLAQHAPGVTPDVLRNQIAQEFGKFLAANQHLSLLPYASNQAIGGSMAARFVEGDAFQLSIPEADYAISLDIPGFKRVDLGQTSTSRGYLYGAFADIAIREPLSGQAYFAQRIKQGAAINVPATQAATDDWTNAYDTLTLLFNNFTAAIGQPDGGHWAKSALPAGKAARTELAALEELIRSCR